MPSDAEQTDTEQTQPVFHLRPENDTSFITNHTGISRFL